jgi:Cathepsin propeptide inhibitor domain (I29)
MAKTKILLSIVLLFVTTALGKGTIATQIGSPPTLAQKVAFLAYTAKYGKSYSSTLEFNTRFQNWLATDNYLSEFKNNQVGLQHNKFFDWSRVERDGVLNSKLAAEVLNIPDLT